MSSGAPQIRKQHGVVLLAFFAILFIAGAGAIISILDFNSLNRNRDTETFKALREAKEALLAYSVLYATNYNPTNATTVGPGYLPCPDTNGNGVENLPCSGNSLGRLPRSIILPSGKIFSLSDFKSTVDEQFWYSVASTFSHNPMGVINSSTVTNMTLNGQDRIAAVVIAPGLANNSQSRPSNNSNRYLEDINTSAPNFVSSTTVNSDLFNDKVLGITIDEIMRPVTRQVAALLKQSLDAFHVTELRYPANQAEFDLEIAPTMSWFLWNQWQARSEYTYINDDQAILAFTGCTNMIYTVNYSPPNSFDDLKRTGLQC